MQSTLSSKRIVRNYIENTGGSQFTVEMCVAMTLVNRWTVFRYIRDLAKEGVLRKQKSRMHGHNVYSRCSDEEIRQAELRRASGKVSRERINRALSPQRHKDTKKHKEGSAK